MLTAIAPKLVITIIREERKEEMILLASRWMIVRFYPHEMRYISRDIFMIAHDKHIFFANKKKVSSKFILFSFFFFFGNET